MPIKLQAIQGLTPVAPTTTSKRGNRVSNNWAELLSDFHDDNPNTSLGWCVEVFTEQAGKQQTSDQIKSRAASRVQTIRLNLEVTGPREVWTFAVREVAGQMRPTFGLWVHYDGTRTDEQLAEHLAIIEQRKADAKVRKAERDADELALRAASADSASDQAEQAEQDQGDADGVVLAAVAS